jgi:hypothetical protein
MTSQFPSSVLPNSIKNHHKQYHWTKLDEHKQYEKAVRGISHGKGNSDWPLQKKSLGSSPLGGTFPEESFSALGDNPNVAPLAQNNNPNSNTDFNVGNSGA